VIHDHALRGATLGRGGDQSRAQRVTCIKRRIQAGEPGNALDDADWVRLSLTSARTGHLRGSYAPCEIEHVETKRSREIPI
jgi:hypothetical protein